MSFFFHTVGFPFYEFSNEDEFDHFFRLFVEGRVDYGDYFEMVPEWWRMSGEKSNIHFLLYEDLKTDFEGWGFLLFLEMDIFVLKNNKGEA